MPGYLDLGATASYFLLELFLPLLIFVVSAYFLWRIQSRIALFSYYKLVLPQLRRNNLFYRLLGSAAVASHEILGHALVGVATGSDAEMAADLTPESGKVRIAHKVSAWGYLSAILATLAPCFAPPALILLAAIFLFPSTLAFIATDVPSLASEILSNFLSIASIAFNSDLTNPFATLFTLLLAVLSSTAGASRADFAIIRSQTRKYWYFALFLLLAASAGLEILRAFFSLPSALGLFFPAISFLFLAFLTVMLGVAISLAFAAYLKSLYGFSTLLKLASAVAFPAAYFAILYTTLSFPLPYYLSALLLSLLALAIWTALLRLAFSPVRGKEAPSRGRRMRMRSLRDYEEG